MGRGALAHDRCPLCRREIVQGRWRHCLSPKAHPGVYPKGATEEERFEIFDKRFPGFITRRPPRRSEPPTSTRRRITAPPPHQELLEIAAMHVEALQSILRKIGRSRS